MSVLHRCDNCLALFLDEGFLVRCQDPVDPGKIRQWCRRGCLTPCAKCGIMQYPAKPVAQTDWSWRVETGSRSRDYILRVKPGERPRERVFWTEPCANSTCTGAPEFIVPWPHTVAGNGEVRTEALVEHTKLRAAPRVEYMARYGATMLGRRAHESLESTKMKSYEARFGGAPWPGTRMPRLCLQLPGPAATVSAAPQTDDGPEVAARAKIGLTAADVGAAASLVHFRRLHQLLECAKAIDVAWPSGPSRDSARDLYRQCYDEASRHLAGMRGEFLEAAGQMLAAHYDPAEGPQKELPPCPVREDCPLAPDRQNVF